MGIIVVHLRFSEDNNSNKAERPKTGFGASILIVPVICFGVTLAYLNPNLFTALTDKLQTMVG